MTNIEIHGHGTDMKTPKSIARDILSLFLGHQLAKEIVITIVPDACLDLQGKHHPFFRVFSTFTEKNEKELHENIDKIIQKLKNRFSMDIEVLIIHSFYKRILH